MRKLMAILALGTILYSCTESEKPDQLNLDEDTFSMDAIGSNGLDVNQIPLQIPRANSENSKILANFTPIGDVSGTYTTETTLLDISGIICFTRLNSVTDGALTLDFDRDMDKRQAGGCGWAWTFGGPPAVEGPKPHVLFGLRQNSLEISLSAPVKSFGFEMQPTRRDSPFEFQVSFFSGGDLIGTIIKSLFTDGNGGAELFAASTNASFDKITIEANTPTGFALGQFRYILADDKNPFTVDVKPDSCENPVNVNSMGVIPVAILASMDLDVNDIDLSTVLLNGVAPKSSLITDLGGFYEKEEACDCYPAEYDGVMDLGLEFDTQEVVATLGEVADGEQVTVSLSFDTMDGKSWTGEDCIWIIKKGKK